LQFEHVKLLRYGRLDNTAAMAVFVAAGSGFMVASGASAAACISTLFSAQGGSGYRVS
jgi:hypothetical protein